jgi:hypothetical protein
MRRLQFVLDGIAGDASRHICDAHVSDCVAEIAFDARHRPSLLLRFLDQLVLGDRDVLDAIDLHAAWPVGEPFVLLSRLAIRHVHRHQILLQLHLQILVCFLQRSLLFSQTHAIDSSSIEAHPEHVQLFVHVNDGLSTGKRGRRAVIKNAINFHNLFVE